LSELYRKNPFVLLGLPATADSRQVRRRVEELEITATLESVTGRIDGDKLRRIRQQLETPSERFRAEIFWMHSAFSDPSTDVRDVVALATEIQRLLSFATAESNEQRILILHDVAVLRHASWLQRQAEPEPESASREMPPPTSISDGPQGGVGRASQFDLRLALGNWVEVLGSPDLERYFESRRVSVGAPTVALADTASAEILGSLAEIASKAIDRRGLHEGSGLIRLIRSSGFEPAAIDRAIGEATKSLRGEIARGLSAIATAGHADGQPEAVVRTERELLLNLVLGPVGRFELIDRVPTDDALFDRVALACRSVSVDVYNKLEDAMLASALLDIALEKARSTSTISQLAADRAQVRYQYHSAAAGGALDSTSWAVGAAHAELAEELAPSEQSRVQISGVARAARQRAQGRGVDAAKALISANFESAKRRLQQDIETSIRYEAISYAPLPTRPPPVAATPAPQARSANNRGQWIVAGAVVLVLAIVGAINASSSANRSAAATTPRTTPSASPRTTPSASPPVRSTFSAPVSVPQQAPTVIAPATPRAVALRADQMIIPPAEFPFANYQVSLDEAVESTGWVREFSSETANYYHLRVVVFVGRPNHAGTSDVAAEDCSYTDSQGRPVTTATLPAEVVGDGAKACRIGIGPRIRLYVYVTADRNVTVYVDANPRYSEVTDASALADLVIVARRQLQIIDRVAPR
jgi:hypothetical protein